MTPWEAYQQKNKQKQNQSGKQSNGTNVPSASTNERVSPWEDYSRRVAKGDISTLPELDLAYTVPKVPESKGFFQMPDTQRGIFLREQAKREVDRYNEKAKALFDAEALKPYAQRAIRAEQAAQAYEQEASKVYEQWRSRIRTPEEIRKELAALTGGKSVSTDRGAGRGGFFGTEEELKAKQNQLEEELGWSEHFAAEADREEKLSYDLTEGQKKIDDLTRAISLRKDIDAIGYDVPTDIQREYDGILRAYGLSEGDDLQFLLGNEKSYYSAAKKVHEAEKTAQYIRDIMSRPDFAEKSKYVSTANGEEAYANPWMNNLYTVTGFDDIEYDYINKNPKAIEIQGHNDAISNRTFLGLDGYEKQHMTEDEIAVYNYLYATESPEAAKEFLVTIASDLNYRDRKWEEEKWKTYADKHPVQSSAFSVLTSPVKGLSYLAQTADYLDDGELEEDAGYNRHSYINSSIRSAVSQKIEESGKWGKVGSFLYNTGMSMGDFLMSTAISGGNGTIAMTIMGTGAAADTVISSKDRGLSDGQAFTLGTIAGLAEAVTEKISLEALLNPDARADGAFKYVLKNMLAEGSEEAASDVINLFADILVSKDQSQWSESIRKYMNEGKTREEAFGIVFAEQAETVGLDFLGGVLSGGGMSGVSVGLNFASNYIDQAKAKKAEKLLDKTDAVSQEDAEALPDWEQYEQEHAGDRFTRDRSGDIIDQTEDMERWREETYEKAQEYSDEELQQQIEEYRAKRDDSSQDEKSREIFQYHLDALEYNQAQRQKNNAALNEQRVEGVNYSGAEGLNDGGQWNEGVGSRGPVGGLEEGTGRSIPRGQGKTEKTIVDDIRANAAAQSSREIGIIGGSDTADLRVIPAERIGESASWSRIRNEVEARGQKLVLVVGKMETVDPVTKKVYSHEGIRQVAADGTVTYYIKADKLSRSAEKIYKHEDFHDIVHNNPELLGDLVLALEMEYGKQELMSLIYSYVEAFDGVYGIFEDGMTEESEHALAMKYAEEIFADAYGEINRVRRNTTGAKKILQSQTDSVQRAAKNRKATETKTAPPGQRYSYAGRNARTADHEALQKAQQMLEDGYAMEDVRRATGWHQGFDGKWRFEIDDSQMEFRRDGDARLMEEEGYRRLQDLSNKETLTEIEAAELESLEEEYADRVWEEKYMLRDFLRHDALFEAYPRLKSVSLVFDSLEGGTLGYFSKRSNTMVLSNELLGSPEETLIHELQHIIQRYEEFATGASPSYWESRIQEGFAKRSSGTGEEMTAGELYRNTAGEIEARDSASRRNLSAEDRRLLAPNYGNPNTVVVEDETGWIYSADNKDTSTIKEQIQGCLEQLNKMDVVARVSVPENLQKKDEAAKLAIEKLKATGYTVDRQGYGKIIFGPKDIDKGLRYADTPAEKAAILVLPQVLKRGIEVGFHGQHKGREKQTITFAAPVELNGIRGNMAVVVNKHGNTYYAHRIMTPDGKLFRFSNEKKDATRELSQGVTFSGSLAETTSAASKDNIRQPEQNVKQNFSVDDDVQKLDEGYARHMAESEESRRGRSEPEWEAVRSSMDEYNAAAKEAKEQRAEKNSITALKNRIQKNEQMLRELSNMRTMAKKSNFLSRNMDKNIEVRRSIIQETLEIDRAALKVKQEAKKQEDKSRKQKKREEEIQKVKARQATEEMVNEVMELFFTKRGERYDVREMLNELADQIVKDGRITNDIRDQLLRVLYENSEIVVEPDEYFGDIRRFVQHVKIYVPDSVRAEFGDDWNGFRNATFGQRIYLTNNPNDMGINTVAEELRGIFGNVFAENASLKEQLERIYELAEEGKAEKLSLPEMMRIERDNFGWSVEDQMDEMERKLDKILQTFSEKASFEIDIRQKTLRVMNKQREGFRKTLELRRDRVAENALMNQVLKRAQRLKAYQKRATPSVKRMIDEQIGDLDTLARSISSKGLEDMQQIIDNYNQTAAELGDAFIANPEIVDRFERVKQRHISDMSVEEVRALGEALTGVIRQIQNYNRMVSEERNIFLTDMANRAQKEIVESEGSRGTGYLQKFMQGQLNAKVLFGKISGYVDGAWKMLSDRLSHGEELRRQYQMRAMELFDTFLSDKRNQEWLKKATGKDAVWETVSVKGANVLVDGAVADTTDSIELTSMMKVSLLMHSKNADNLRHIGYYEKEGDIYVLRGGGATIPDKELYKKGKMKEAYARGQVLVIPPDVVRAIARSCTAQEKAFAALLTKYFDNMAKSAINEVSLQVDGWERACVQNYFPIQSDKAFIVTENGLIMQDLSLQGSPFLKERSHKGKNPMYLFDATDVLYRNIAQVSKYYGLTRGLRDLHAVMNATYYQTDKNVEDSTAENELLQKVKKQEGWGKVNVGSVEKALASKWGPEAKDYIERLSAHLQGGKSEGTVLDELLTKLRGHYARSVISFNPSSVAKQVSSYLVAYSYLDAEDLVKGLVTTNYFGNAKEAVMNLSRYSAVYWYRNQGNVNTEIKEYTERKGMLERLPLGFQWTQMMDSAVTRRLLAACMHHVSRKMGLQPGSQESIDAGTDRYWSEVAKLFNKVVLDTQSNTSTMERPDILRGDKHGIAKFITMFRGDPSQQHNLQVEARGMWKAAKKAYKTNPSDANLKRLKDAQKHLAKTTSAVFMGQLTVGVITSLLAWLTFRDKDYYDEEGKFLWKKFFGDVGLNAAEGYAGLILGLDWISSLVESAITGNKWYGPEVLGFESVKTFGEDVAAFFSAAFNLDYREGKKQLRKVAKSAGLLFGIPVTNIEKYLLAATRMFAPELAERWENIWDETEKNDLQYRSPRVIEEAISVLLDNRVDGLSNEDKAEIARLYITGGIGAVPTAIPSSFAYINEDSEEVTVTMSPKQKEKYREVWNEFASEGLSELLTSEQYESADDEGKTVYIDKLYKFAAQMAKTAVEPKKEPEKWVKQGLDAQKNGVSLGEYVIFRVDLSGIDGKNQKGETVTGLKTQRDMELIEAMGWTDKQEKAIWMDVVASDSSAAITEALTKAGMTWDQVNDIVVMKDNKLERMAAIAETRQSDAVKVKAMCVFANEKEKKLLTVGLRYGIKPEWYMEVLKNANADGKGTIIQAEAKEYIDAMGLSWQDKTALYQMVTDAKVTKNYPFYQSYAEEFYYEVHKDDPE